MRIGEHDTHPLADAFPLMEGDDLAGLIDDVKVNGLRMPIVLFQVRGHGSPDLILDGRNRYRACIAAKVEPRFAVYDGPEDEQSLIQFVVSVNMSRRDMTADQRALVARRLGAILAKAIKADRKRAKVQPMLPKVDEATEEQIDQVIADGVPELEQLVESGAIDASRAAQISALEPDAQRDVLAQLAKVERPEPVRAKQDKPTVLVTLAMTIGHADAEALRCALVVLDRNPHGEVRRGAEVIRVLCPWLPKATQP